MTKEPEPTDHLKVPPLGHVPDMLVPEPSLQFYSGNFLNGTVAGKLAHLYRMGDGMVLEPQKFRDTSNHPQLVSARADPGKPYRHVYRLTTFSLIEII